MVKVVHVLLSLLYQSNSSINDNDRISLIYKGQQGAIFQIETNATLSYELLRLQQR